MTTNTNTATFAASIKMHHATRTKAEKLAAMFAAEYPALTLTATEGEELEDHGVFTHDLAGFVVIHAIDTEAEDEIWAGDKVPSLAEVLDECAEREIDPADLADPFADEEEGEPKASGSVVPESYRARYRITSTTGRSNGDWLAERLAADCLDSKEKLILVDFVAILVANGVSLSGKWAQTRFTQAVGWQGRFRMNGRQLLEKAIAKAGHYIDHTGAKVTPHVEWTEANNAKHAKWLAKEAKAEAAATKAIISATEA